MTIKTYYKKDERLIYTIKPGQNDRRRFGEIIFLLAAKLKYDVLCDIPYDEAGFLHSDEITRLNDAGITKVQKTPYQAIRYILRKAREKSSSPECKFLHKLFIAPDQLWHLICYCGRTGDTDSQDHIWWLNTLTEAVSFQDEKGNITDGQDLKKILMKLFPAECCLTDDELKAFQENIEQYPDVKWGKAKITDTAVKQNQNFVAHVQPSPFMHLTERLAHFPGRYPTGSDFDSGVYYRDDMLHKGIMEILKTKKRCLIVGTPGCGKTTLALAIGYEFSKDTNNTVYYHDASSESDAGNWAEAIRAYGSNVLVILDNIHCKSEDINNLLCDIGGHRAKLLLISRKVERRAILSIHPDHSHPISYMTFLSKENAIKHLNVSRTMILNIMERLSHGGKIEKAKIGNITSFLKKCQGDLHILRFYLKAWERKRRFGCLSDLEEETVLDDVYRYYLKGKPYKDELLGIAALSQLEIPVDAGWIGKNVEALQAEGLIESKPKDKVRPGMYITWLRIYHSTPARYLLLSAAYSEQHQIRSVDQFTLKCLQDYLGISPYNFFKVFYQLYINRRQEWYSQLLNVPATIQTAKQILKQAKPQYIKSNIRSVLGFSVGIMWTETNESFKKAQDLVKLLLMRISAVDLKLADLRLWKRMFMVTKELEIDPKFFATIPNFGVLGEQAKKDKVGIITIRAFLESVCRSGVRNGQIVEFCKALDFHALGEQARKNKVGLATVQRFVQLTRQSGVGNEQLREFCEVLDFYALGEQARKNKMSIGTVATFIRLIHHSGVGNKQIRKFYERLDFTSLGQLASKRKSSPISAGDFISYAIQAKVPIDKISSFCNELGSNLWGYTCIIGVVASSYSYKLSKDAKVLLSKFSVDVCEDLLSKADIKDISTFFRAFDGKVTIIQRALSLEVKFEILDKNLSQKIKASSIRDIAYFLFNFYYIRRPDLSYYFKLKVEENVHVIMPKLEEAELNEIDLFLWNIWMLCRSGERPCFLDRLDFVNILSRKPSEQNKDLKSVLGIIGTYNLSGSKLPVVTIPKHLYKTARDLCIQEAEKGSHNLIRMCGNDLFFSAKEKGRIKDALENIDTTLDIPNLRIAIERLSERLECQTE